MHIGHINLAKEFSGGERQTLNLMLSLRELSLQQTLLCRPGSPLEQEAQNHGIDTLPVRHLLLGHRIRKRFDLVHCHEGRSVYWGYLENLLSGTPYVITRRVPNVLDENLITLHAYKQARAVICISSAVATAVAVTVDSPDAITVIPDSFTHLPHNEQEAARIRDRFQPGPIISQAGKLLHHKGFHISIEAARQVLELYPSTVFIFLGDGKMLRTLKLQAGELKNVIFAGYQKNISDWLAASDIFIFPSLKEGLGSSILEAMNSNLPVIASNTGGIPDIVRDGETGLLCEPGNPQDLADNILRLIESPPLRDHLKNNALRQLVNFTPEKIAGDYARLYADILHST